MKSSSILLFSGLLLASCSRFEAKKFDPYLGPLQEGAAGSKTVATAVLTDSNTSIVVAGFRAGPDGTQGVVSAYAGRGEKLWSTQLGAGGQQTYIFGAAMDSANNIYVAGYANAGVEGQAPVGRNDLFLAKLSPTGSKLWTRQMGVPGQSVYAYSVTRDASDNILVSGYTTGAFDGNPRTGAYDAFVVKFDKQGVRKWSRQFGSAGQRAVGQIVSCDPAGNVYVTGKTSGALPGNSQTGSNDLFVVKLDGAGNRVWIRQFGAANAYALAFGAAADYAGNIFVSGQTNGAFSGRAPAGTQDMFLAKIRATGQLDWVRQSGAPGRFTGAGSLATDASGNLFVGGNTSGALDGNAQLGAMDSFVIKYSPAGEKIWSRQFGAQGQVMAAHAVTTDAAGSVLLAGHTTGALSGTTRAGDIDLFVTKFTNDGVQVGPTVTSSPGAVASQFTFGAGTFFLLDSDGGYLTDEDGGKILAF